MIDYSKCPFCYQLLDVGYPTSCQNSKCHSEFTKWVKDDYYFIRCYQNDKDKHSPTELVVEASSKLGLTLIRIRLQAYILADVDRIYNLYNPEELNQLLKILDRLYKNLSLR